jgi:putative methionine-R-sulfoxide reductase with GAF domain
MKIVCTKCRGLAAPAAQMKTFEFKGQTLHCIELISSCTVCGHSWTDETYDTENSHNVEQACVAATQSE